MTQDGRAEELEPAKRRIMEATYRALQKHGYGNLTIQHIADEFENSKTLLYYHYDGKDELLVDFLDYVLTQFLNSLPRGTARPKRNSKRSSTRSSPRRSPRRPTGSNCPCSNSG